MRDNKFKTGNRVLKIVNLVENFGCVALLMSKTFFTFIPVKGAYGNQDN